MAVHSKNPSFAELQREKVAASVQESIGNITETAEPIKPAKSAVPEPKQVSAEPPKAPVNVIKTVTTESGEKKRKDVLIGIHVTEDERNELRKLFCSNGFSLATAYRAAMSYLRQDIELGKAYITNNGEIFRK